MNVESIVTLVEGKRQFFICVGYDVYVKLAKSIYWKTI